MQNTKARKEEVENKVEFYAAALQSYPKDIHGVTLSEEMESESFKSDWENYTKHYTELEEIKKEIIK